jgi:hypothetical protein
LQGGSEIDLIYWLTLGVAQISMRRELRFGEELRLTFAKPHEEIQLHSSSVDPSSDYGP